MVRKQIINVALTVLLAFAIALALAASMYLDSDWVAPATQDATQSARCAEGDPKCMAVIPIDPTQDRIKDPRVQRTLRHICAHGETWACQLVRQERGAL